MPPLDYHDIPDPHASVSGRNFPVVKRRVKSLENQAKKYRPVWANETEIATVSRFSVRLIDTRTGKAYTLNEIKNLIGSPEDPNPSLLEIEERLTEAEAALESIGESIVEAVRYDALQTLNPEERETARQNIEAVGLALRDGQPQSGYAAYFQGTIGGDTDPDPPQDAIALIDRVEENHVLIVILPEPDGGGAGGVSLTSEEIVYAFPQWAGTQHTVTVQIGEGLRSYADMVDAINASEFVAIWNAKVFVVYANGSLLLPTEGTGATTLNPRWCGGTRGRVGDEVLDYNSSPRQVWKMISDFPPVWSEVPITDDSGKIPARFIPAMDLTNALPVADEAERLALTLEAAQSALVVQADNGSSWMLISNGDPSNAGDWVSISLANPFNQTLNSGDSVSFGGLDVYGGEIVGHGDYIKTCGTFRLDNGFHVTTVTHSPTGERDISFPDASGTLALTSDIPAVPITGDGAGLTLSGGNLSVDDTVITTSGNKTIAGNMAFANATAENLTVSGNVTIPNGSLSLAKLATDPLARTNHTGTQTQSTIVNLVSDLAGKAPKDSPVFTGTVANPINVPLTIVTAATLTAVAGANYMLVPSGGTCVISDPATGAVGESYSVTIASGVGIYRTEKILSGQTYKIFSGSGFTALGANVNTAGTIFNAYSSGMVAGLADTPSYQPSRFELIRVCDGTYWKTLSPACTDFYTQLGSGGGYLGLAGELSIGPGGNASLDHANWYALASQTQELKSDNNPSSAPGFARLTGGVKAAINSPGEVALQLNGIDQVELTETGGLRSKKNIAVTSWNLGSGTVSCVAGTSTVTGSGTSFTTTFTVGDFIKVGSAERKVTSITTGTSLTIEGAFTSELTAQPYSYRIVKAALNTDGSIAGASATLATPLPVASGGTGLNTPATADRITISYTGTNDIPGMVFYTTLPLNTLKMGASGEQVTEAGTGKWIESFWLPAISDTKASPTGITTLGLPDLSGVVGSFSLNNGGSASLNALTSISLPQLTTVGSFSLNNGGSASLNALTSVSLPQLTTVGSSFSLSNGGSASLNALTSVSLPQLTTVGSSFSLNNGGSASLNALTSISLPQLTTVGSSFALNSGFANASLNALTSISLPQLTTVGSSFSLNNASTSFNALTSISLPQLTTVGSFALNNSSASLNALTSVSLPQLTTVGSFALNNSGGNASLNALTSVSLPQLTTVGSSFSLNNASASLSALTSISLPALKFVNGDFLTSTHSLDRHVAWKVATPYFVARSITNTPASAFSGAATIVTVSLASHGFVGGEIITISGLDSITAGVHLYNAASVPVTFVDANTFTYPIAAGTTAPASGTALIQQAASTVVPVTRNGFKYLCTTAGTSHASAQPTWPTTVGNTVSDNGIVWTCVESSLPHVIGKLESMDGTSGTTRYGANRFVNFVANSATITTISTAAGVATVTATAHGLVTGSHVAISGCTGTALPYNGVWIATVTGANTFTIPVPTTLNGIAQAGAPVFTTACPPYTGTVNISTAVVNSAADAHDIQGTTQLRNIADGYPLPVFFAGDYNRGSDINGAYSYVCAESGMTLWYHSASKRWVISPTSLGTSASPSDYASTPAALPITSSPLGTTLNVTGHQGPTTAGKIFTVYISGSNAQYSGGAINGTWTVTAIGASSFTLPFTITTAGTVQGTVAVLNQAFLQGKLTTSSITSPVQAVKHTVTCASHGYSTGDFVHFYGAQGTHAPWINDLFTSSSDNRMPTAITVTDANTFTCLRLPTSLTNQPALGTLTLTIQPHMRRSAAADTAAYAKVQKMRARGVCVTITGMNGV